MKRLSLTFKDDDSQPQSKMKKYEQDQYIYSEPTFTDKCQYYATLVRNSHTLMKYFLSLYDKNHEKELPPKTKKRRNQAESVVFWSSLTGRAFGAGLLATQLTILNGPRVNPLRDLGMLGATIAGIYLMDSLPLAFYWPYFEDTLIKRDDMGELTKDPYSSANLNKYKVWYYKRLY